MALPLYLAMTAAEIAACDAFPQPMGWMACHFSPYGTGLSNCPASLPREAMLIVNDRTPIAGHDGTLIAEQLASLVEKLEADSVLLDFQRENCPETATAAKIIIDALPCPTAISAVYAAGLNCPVLLPPPPPDTPLADHLGKWDGRELWLEAALTAAEITVTAEGSIYRELSSVHTEGGFCHQALCCHYRAEEAENALRFTLWRTPEDLAALLKEAEGLGVTRAVGLYQELAGHHPPV